MLDYLAGLAPSQSQAASSLAASIPATPRPPAEEADNMDDINDWQCFLREPFFHNDDRECTVQEWGAKLQGFSHRMAELRSCKSTIADAKMEPFVAQHLLGMPLAASFAYQGRCGTPPLFCFQTFTAILLTCVHKELAAISKTLLY